jgi:hypothetical protein
VTALDDGVAVLPGDLTKVERCAEERLEEQNYNDTYGERRGW